MRLSFLLLLLFFIGILVRPNTKYSLIYNLLLPLQYLCRCHILATVKISYTSVLHMCYLYTIYMVPLKHPTRRTERAWSMLAPHYLLFALHASDTLPRPHHTYLYIFVYLFMCTDMYVCMYVCMFHADPNL